jgi:NAD(P)H-nitrite reductase large subunit
MSENIPDKGAAVQKDMKTYAIIPYIPGGMVDPQTLRKIADVTEKYGAKALKMTSEHRIAIIGIQFEDIDKIWKDLGMKPGGFTGKKVRPAKFCVGNSYCKMGKQNTIEMGMKLDELYQGIELPNKIKIGVSGCQNSCAEPAVRDIGLIGTKKGWNLLVGGTCGMKPRIGQVLAKNLSDGEIQNLIGKIIDYYKENEEKKRLGRFIDKIGFEKFSEELDQF